MRASDLLDTHGFEPTWEPLIVFVAGLLNDPLRLVEILADRSKDDLYRHRLGLLCGCYRVLGSARQTDIGKRMESVFEDILRIARRCEHDDEGHRKPWLEWVEMLLASARQALIDEASSHESDRRLEATAELLEMEAVDPLGGPIQDVVREAVLRELEEHGQKYGSRLHVSAPGGPKGNVDLELFADNPAAVIKLLHTFNGPSPYLRDRDDPNEEKERMRHWNAQLLYGTRYWPEVLRQCRQAVSEGADPDRDGALGILLFAASGTELLDLMLKTFHRRASGATMRTHLLEELNERGWRFRFCGRRVEVLRKGREETRAAGSPASGASAVTLRS